MILRKYLDMDNVFESVPFTRDYYTELTPQQTADVLDMYKKIKQSGINYTIKMGIKSLLYCAISFTVITFIINNFDLQEALRLEYSSWFVVRVILSVFSYGFAVYFWIREFVFLLKARKYDEEFFIAKGKVLKVNSEKNLPKKKYNKDDTIDTLSVFNCTGNKVTMDIAVSDNEKLCDLDISEWQFKLDKILTNTIVIVLYYPQKNMYYYRFYF